MSIIKELTQDLQEIVKQAGYEVENLVLQPSGRKDLGQYQLNDAMTLAKKYGKNPRMIAEDITKFKVKDKNAYEINEKLYINQDIEFIWPSINGNKIIEKGKCLALREQIAILVDGTVVPCCLDAEGIINLGNINNETLEEILNKELTKKIKTNFSNGKITCELCKTCGFLERLENKRKNK